MQKIGEDAYIGVEYGCPECDYTQFDEPVFYCPKCKKQVWPPKEDKKDANL
jgi:hypothetical protein